MQIGQTFCDSSTGGFWTCVDILMDGKRFRDFGVEHNNNAVVSAKSHPFVCVCWWETRLECFIDRFAATGNGCYSNVSRMAEINEVYLRDVLPERIRNILNQKRKRFVSVFYPALNLRLVACLNEDGEVAPFDGEKLPTYWPLNVKVTDFTELDITPDQYFAINGFNRKNVAQFKAEILEKLGCQKENLTPVLDPFVELLKALAKAKQNDHTNAARIVLSRVLVDIDAPQHFGDNQKEIFKLFKDIQQAL